MAAVNVEEIQKTAQENIETSIKSFSELTKGVQAISVEVADYSKKSFEQGSAALEKLIGVKSLDKAIEVQTEYLKAAYEGYVAEVNKVGELYVDLAKQMYKPYEGLLAKVGK
ncbi:MAG: phasin family protein [Ancalomicrobiaceae bacterium]|nr:phasin family protein [Ancalomicrobiaceae bacterium]